MLSKEHHCVEAVRQSHGIHLQGRIQRSLSVQKIYQNLNWEGQEYEQYYNIYCNINTTNTAANNIVYIHSKISIKF